MRKYLLVTLVVIMALLAGCTGGGQTATDSNPASATASGEAPQNIETFYVQTEQGEFFCIRFEKADGYEGHSGLSCTHTSHLSTEGSA